MNKLTFALATLLLAGACGPKHISATTPKHRVYEVKAQKPALQASADGSLWSNGTPASMLFTDQRALRENDLVVVKVEELADSQRRADTDLRHEAKMTADVGAFLAAAGVKQPDVSAGATSALSNSLNALGSTRRTEKLMATVPALVQQVLPNGLLFIEGHRAVLVNEEEHHFYISGVVRPIDIDQQNSIKSSLIADAEIEFTATGNLTDNQKQGWLSRFINWVWPF